MHQLIIESASRLVSYFNMERDDDPFLIFDMLEQSKSEIDEVIECLAIQERCLFFICRDLQEHGTSHLQFYAQGKMSLAEFERLHQQVTDELIQELRRQNTSSTYIWKMFKKVPPQITKLLSS